MLCFMVVPSRQADEAGGGGYGRGKVRGLALGGDSRRACRTCIMRLTKAATGHAFSLHACDLNTLLYTTVSVLCR